MRHGRGWPLRFEEPAVDRGAEREARPRRRTERVVDGSCERPESPRGAPGEPLGDEPRRFEDVATEERRARDAARHTKPNVARAQGLTATPPHAHPPVRATCLQRSM